MEVDRVWRMGGVGQEPSPSWNRDKLHRRRFTEEVEPPVEAESEEAGGADAENRHEGTLDMMA